MKQACRRTHPRSAIITAATTKPEEDVEQIKSAPPTNGHDSGNGKSGSPQPPTLPPIPPPRQKLFAEVLGQKLLDTGDDIFMHASRAFRGHAMEEPTAGGLRNGEDMSVYVSNKPIVLILGFGWAAHSLSKVCAWLLCGKLARTSSLSM